MYDSASPLLQKLLTEQPETGNHGLRVWGYAEPLAKVAGLSVLERRRLHSAAVLHDVGKLEVPRGILFHPGELTRSHREIVKGHVRHGHRIVHGHHEELDEVAALLALHHERLDGRGYPHGLSAEEIPLAARILSIADTWDAMTAHRPYRMALSFEQAADELVRASNGQGERGGQLDGELVREFLRLCVRQLPHRATVLSPAGTGTQGHGGGIPVPSSS